MLRNQVNKRDECSIEELISPFPKETSSTINTHNAGSSIVKGPKHTL